MKIYMVQCQLNSDLKKYHTEISERVNKEFPDAYIIPSTHVTLEYPFITEDYSKMRNILVSVTRTLPKSPVHVRSVGGFPFEIVYLGAQLDAALHTFRRQLSLQEGNLIERKSTFGGNNYTPHVTVARVGSPQRYDQVREYVKRDLESRYPNGFRCLADNITIISHEEGDITGPWCVEEQVTLKEKA